MIRWAAATAAAATLLLAVGAAGARASVATNLAAVSYGGDTFENYDFNSTQSVATNVDWPVDLIFWGNASISKVYNKMGWFWSGSNEYALLNDGSGNVWVSSGGRKTAFCSSSDTHFRLYAPSAGYLTNPVLGHYVIATAHLDKNECSSSRTYGWNETAEANVAARAAAVWGAAAVQANAQLMPDGTTQTLPLFQNAQTGWDGNHYFDNNGYPTLIKVP